MTSLGDRYTLTSELGRGGMAGAEAGQLYFVMPLLERESLRARLTTQEFSA